MSEQTPAKRSFELGVEAMSPCKVQRTSQRSTITVNCGGRKFECWRQTLQNMGSCFFQSCEFVAGDDDNDLFVDFKPEAFDVVLSAHRLARTDLPKAIFKIQEGLQRWSADVQDLLHYLGLHWLLGTSINLPDVVACPECCSFDELCNLPLAGVLEHLHRNQLSPKTYTGDCFSDHIVEKSWIHVSEELNDLASRKHQKENEHTDVVARIIRIRPFSRCFELSDFEDFACPTLGYDGRLNMDPPSPSLFWDPFDDRDYSEDIRLLNLDEHDYYMENGFPSYIEDYGLRRYVIDIGPQRYLSLSAVVAAFSGSLLDSDCVLQLHCSNGSKLEAKVLQKDQTKVAITKLETQTPLVGRVFALTVIPSSYSKYKPKTIGLEALEFYGTFFDAPNELQLHTQACFRFDDKSDSFKKVEAEP